MMKENYYWILLGIALGILIYLADKYIFWMKIFFSRKIFIFSNMFF